MGLSFLLYFDLEIGFEAFGGRYTNEFFQPFFSSPLLELAFLSVFLGPWAMKAGYAVAFRLVPLQLTHNSIHIKHKKLFYYGSIALCGIVCSVSIAILLLAPSLWIARTFVGKLLGPIVIIFYIPMGILGFYVRQPESRTRNGKLFTAALVSLSVLATVPVGERTLMLLPVLIVAIFAGTPSLTKFVGAGVLLLVAAVVLAQFTKVNLSENTSTRDTGSRVFSGDIARGPVLTGTLGDSSVIGTHVMPYPGAGYVYAALLYVPRFLVPFKGDSTAGNFTAHRTNTRVRDITWGLAIGAIDELALNFGWLFVIPGLFVYGACFYLLDRASVTVPVLKVASLLSAIWLSGYDLAAILNTFGAIALFGGVCHLVFVTRKRVFTLRQCGSEPVALGYSVPSW